MFKIKVFFINISCLGINYICKGFFKMNRLFGSFLCFFLAHSPMLHPAAPRQQHGIKATYPLHLAAYYGKTCDIDALLRDGAGVNEQNCDDYGSPESWSAGQTPLNIAAAKGHLEAARLLIARGADTNLADNSGFTPLHSAAINGHEDIVQLLLTHQALVDKKSTDGWTPLHWACREGFLRLAEQLVRAGANVNATTNNESTPLYCAVGANSNNLVFFLITHGADIDCQVNYNFGRHGWVNPAFGNGFTPLHWATYRGNQEIAQMLLASKANVNICDFHGKTALDLASKEHNHDMVRLLQLWPTFAKACKPSLVALIVGKQQNCGRTSPVKMVPLDIIRKICLLSTCMYNVQEMGLLIEDCKPKPECLTCLTRISLDQRVQLQCKHVFCKECLLKLLETSLKPGMAHYLRCPQMDCGGTLRKQGYELTSEDIRAITEGHGNARQLRNAYELVKANEFCRNNPTARKCPTADCLNFWEFAHEDGYPDAKAYRCDCGYKYCRSCCLPWTYHKREKRVLDCDTARRDYGQRDTSEGHAEKLACSMALAEGGFYCINFDKGCRNIIVRLAGCDEMACGKDAHGDTQMDGCGYVFCRQCLLPWEGHEVAYFGGRCLMALRLHVAHGNKWALALQRWLDDDSSRNIYGGGRNYWRQLCRDYGYENAVAYLRKQAPATSEVKKV